MFAGRHLGTLMRQIQHLYSRDLSGPCEKARLLLSPASAFISYLFLTLSTSISVWVCLSLFPLPVKQSHTSQKAAHSEPLTLLWLINHPSLSLTITVKLGFVCVCVCVCVRVCVYIYKVQPFQVVLSADSKPRISLQVISNQTDVTTFQGVFTLGSWQPPRTHAEPFVSIFCAYVNTPKELWPPPLPPRVEFA